MDESLADPKSGCTGIAPVQQDGGKSKTRIRACRLRLLTSPENDLSTVRASVSRPSRLIFPSLRKHAKGRWIVANGSLALKIKPCHRGLSRFCSYALPFPLFSSCSSAFEHKGHPGAISSTAEVPDDLAFNRKLWESIIGLLTKITRCVILQEAGTSVFPGI